MEGLIGATEGKINGWEGENSNYSGILMLRSAVKGNRRVRKTQNSGSSFVVWLYIGKRRSEFKKAWRNMRTPPCTKVKTRFSRVIIESVIYTEKPDITSSLWNLWFYGFGLWNSSAEKSRVWSHMFTKAFLRLIPTFFNSKTSSSTLS